jgi:hypothetical protein
MLVTVDHHDYQPRAPECFMIHDPFSMKDQILLPFEI